MFPSVHISNQKFKYWYYDTCFKQLNFKFCQIGFYNIFVWNYIYFSKTSLAEWESRNTNSTMQPLMVQASHGEVNQRKSSWVMISHLNWAVSVELWKERLHWANRLQTSRDDFFRTEAKMELDLFLPQSQWGTCAPYLWKIAFFFFFFFNSNYTPVLIFFMEDPFNQLLNTFSTCHSKEI